MNDQAGSANSCVYYRCGRGGWRREQKYVLLDMTRHKYFIKSRVKTEKGTLSEGVIEKDPRTGFRIEFVGRIGMQLGKA